MEFERAIARLLRRPFFRQSPATAATAVRDEVIRRLEGQDPTRRNVHIDSGVAYLMDRFESAEADHEVDADSLARLKKLVHDRLDGRSYRR